MSRIRLTRRVTFSSGHRWWFKDRSEEENRALFGPWASPFNHGHNYVLEVTTAGILDPTHGMVVNIKVIDDVLKEHVVKAFDFKSLNDEVEAFAQRQPSLENLLAHLAETLPPLLPSEVELEGMKLEETPLLYAEWRPKEPHVTLTRIYEFAASHRLHVPNLSHEENLRLFGKCNNPMGHGHNYVLEVTVSGPVDPVTGMSVDLNALDQVVHEQVVDRYDHKNLNADLPEFEGRNTTSEVVAEQIFETLRGVVPGKLERVRLFETARNIFEVRADDHE